MGQREQDDPDEDRHQDDGPAEVAGDLLEGPQEDEQQLADAGMTLVKFWLHISEEEQLQRFEARNLTPHKKWKLTDEDWRNREKWDLYEAAVQDMVERTSTTNAPWTLVEGNSKKYARLKVLRTVANALEREVGRSKPRSKKKIKKKNKKKSS